MSFIAGFIAGLSEGGNDNKCDLELIEIIGNLPALAEFEIADGYKADVAVDYYNVTSMSNLDISFSYWDNDFYAPNLLRSPAIIFIRIYKNNIFKLAIATLSYEMLIDYIQIVRWEEKDTGDMKFWVQRQYHKDSINITSAELSFVNNSNSLPYFFLKMTYTIKETGHRRANWIVTPYEQINTTSFQKRINFITSYNAVTSGSANSNQSSNIISNLNTNELYKVAEEVFIATKHYFGEEFNFVDTLGILGTI